MVILPPRFSHPSPPFKKQKIVLYLNPLHSQFPNTFVGFENMKNISISWKINVAARTLMWMWTIVMYKHFMHAIKALFLLLSKICFHRIYYHFYLFVWKWRSMCYKYSFLWVASTREKLKQKSQTYLIKLKLIEKKSIGI